jgi:hypothetical protein
MFEQAMQPFFRRRARLLLTGLVLAAVHARAQAGREPTPKAAAAFDMTGYWASLITQNWRYRMVTPAKGDYIGVPMTPASKRIADAWDPAKDEATGNQCKSYGAAGIMMLPEHLHITWQDENTMRMDVDAGTQTRVFHFGAGRGVEGKPTLQGESAAAWVARRGPGTQPAPTAKYLKVTTTHMLPGYLRKNGIPYSEQAVLTEYYELMRDPGGDQLLVTTVVEDPIDLDQPFILTAQFKKLAGASAWEPAPCSATW